MDKISILRETARKIKFNPESYNWKSCGTCNCGFLIQVATGYDESQIRRFAIQKHGDWESVTELYEKNSGWPVDNILTSLIELGFSLEEIKHLERLSDKKVLDFLGVDSLVRDNPNHVVIYLDAWANLLTVEKKISYLPNYRSFVTYSNVNALFLTH